MINRAQLDELRKVEHFSKLSWIFGNETAKEILDTIDALLHVAEAAEAFDMPGTDIRIKPLHEAFAALKQPGKETT